MRLQKTFNDLEDDVAGSVSKELRQDIELFREKLWLIELLTTEAMIKKPAHWKEIFKECEIQSIEPNDEMSLQILVELKLGSYRSIIEDISKKAEKQWNIEKKLNEITEKMKDVKLDIMVYKNTGTQVLKSLDEVQQLLDDQLNVLMMMKASPFIKPAINKANQLESKIVLIQDTLEGWIKCQRAWMYLEPIFSSEDIKKKLSLEKQKFDGVDKNWRTTIDLFYREPFIWDGIESDKVKNEFDQNNKILDQIQKSLSEYLETKRAFFPRFYFLSDEELLEILAQTKDPLTVQKHINKCFEAISLLEFKGNEEVMAMISAEKETVRFHKSINVNEGEKKGNVERWLLEIEAVMVDTLRRITKESLADEDIPRTQWVLKWPAQVVLAVNMMRWTRDSEAAIFAQKRGEDVKEGKGFASLKEFQHHLDVQLKETVALVRQDLTELQRLTLGALVVIDVHAKDAIEILANRGCESIHDFAWTSQLR